MRGLPRKAKVIPFVRVESVIRGISLRTTGLEEFKDIWVIVYCSDHSLISFERTRSMASSMEGFWCQYSAGFDIVG